MSEETTDQFTSTSFFDQPNVQNDVIRVGPGVPIGMQQIYNERLGIGGAYGAWGESYDNNALPEFIQERLGEPISSEDQLNLAPLGFIRRHHITNLKDDEHLDVEVEVGARFLRAAAQACGWQPEEVEGVLIGMSGPVSNDYTERIAEAAGISKEALKVTMHKACDSSMGSLQLALNPEVSEAAGSKINVAKELFGKKILVGGIEGLSRFLNRSRDLNALQLFGNGAGIIGIIPGKTMSFLVGKAQEVFDEKGVLAVRMYYPHSRKREEGHSLLEVSEAGTNHLRFAGLMHEPEEENRPVDMAGPMGMVKLFVRNGVDVVRDVYLAYQNLMNDLGMKQKELTVGIVHHANYKINQLKASQLAKEGIHISMPWLMSEFGNVSAASNMIAFLRYLQNLKPGDHALLDGFGAGTYYDVMAVALEGQA